MVGVIGLAGCAGVLPVCDELLPHQGIGVVLVAVGIGDLVADGQRQGQRVGRGKHNDPLHMGAPGGLTAAVIHHVQADQQMGIHFLDVLMDAVGAVPGVHQIQGRTDAVSSVERIDGYQNRELDEMDVGESTLTTIQADPSSEYNQQLCEKRPKKYSYQMHFNYQKNNEDGTPDDNWNKAIANTAFRQCFYKGLELTNWYARTNKINPLKCENDYYTMPGVCYNTKGEEYTTLVAKEMGFDKEAYDGKTMIRLRANNGDIADLKKQAMDELSAIGVTFPVHAAYYIIAGNSTALDSATVLKQCFTDSFGDDFIVLDIKTYVSSITQEVRNPQLQSFVINGWGADYGDPVNFVGQEILHDDNAYYSWYYSNIAKVVEAGPADWQKDLVACYEEFTDLVNTAKAIVDDTDARYAAFAKAEASMLNNVLACPCYFEVSWTLTHANEYSKINAMYGPCNYKAVNWETSEEAYTTAQYEEFAAAFDAATKA